MLNGITYADPDKDVGVNHLVSVRRQRSAAIPARVIATCFSLSCFLATAIVGSVARNPAWSVLLWGVVVMVVAYPIGWIIGLVMQRCVNDQIERHKEANPIPEEPGPEVGPSTA